MAKSIKFGDDTYLDISGITAKGKNMSALIGGQIGAYSEATLKDAIIHMMNDLSTANYPIFFGQMIWAGHDQYNVFYTYTSGGSKGALVSNGHDAYLARYVNETNTWVSRISVTVM